MTPRWKSCGPVTASQTLIVKLETNIIKMNIHTSLDTWPKHIKRVKNIIKMKGSNSHLGILFISPV
ncbi:hypothetical protein HanXRQr2_Chr08g0361241 [Helianthus annuus]|uniref:Uncharacterized protein n=1 Tax=Helianthus annuus TaxID=4232 RepID=A0A9K3IIV7_HELAN|nr:hypothetical protein HanXRQr2_Chr08g0361241 [Helianthus annuus]KAJ0903394.1 hypothetical protein HanPSC8_Chr08g0348541 [Helianthus annuus]